MKAAELRERLSAAMGVLGLHDQRQMSVGSDRDGPSPFLTTCTVSLAELEKLAARAEHLVELERAIHDWYVAEDKNDPKPFNISTVIEWARVHDFSMLEPAPSSE